LQGNLQQSYQDLITAAGQFGITGDAADTLARKALGIPKETPIESWVNDKASSVLEGIKGKAESLDGKQVFIDIWQTTHDTTLKKTIEDPGGMGSSIGGRENGSLRGGAATGGRVADIMGFADGGRPFDGRVPAQRPNDMSIDNVLGLVNGKPIGLQGQEWVINGRSSDMYDRELAAINAGTFPKMPGFVGGGRPYSEYAAQSFATPAGGLGSPVMGDVYVQNPFTGDYLLAQVDGRVGAGLAGVSSIAAGRMR
jgi:hypothetical protein